MDILNSNQISTPSNSNNSTVEFFVTSEQQRIINELLPKGYSLQFAPKPARSKSGSFTNKGIALAAAFSRQNDGQMRNSNGQFAAISKSAKGSRGGKLVSQESYGLPQLDLQSMNSGIANQEGFYQNPNNGMTPSMMSSYPNIQNQSQQSNTQIQYYNINKQQMNSLGMTMSAPQLNHQQSQNAQASPHNYSNTNQASTSQQQIPQQMQPQQYQQGMMYGGDYFQQQQYPHQMPQQMQMPYQRQMSQQMQNPHMHQMQQPLYEQQAMHMKRTGPARKNSTAKPRKDKKAKLAEKVSKLKRKNERGMSLKPNKKQQAATAAAAMILSGGMMPEQQKKCLHILHQLQKHKSAYPFLKPVDPIMQECADYYDVIRDPIDLSTVEKNLKQHLYQSPTQFAADVRKIWSNSYRYNNRDSYIFQMTSEMDEFFDEKFNNMDYSKTTKPGVDIKTQQVIDLIKDAMKGSKKTKSVPSSKTNIPLQMPKKSKNPSKLDIPMTMQEKKKLGQSILQLPQDALPQVWEIVKSDGNQQYDDKVLTFDIDALSVRKTRELEQYVNRTLANANKKQSKKQVKIQEKTMSSENKIIQQTFCQDDETAATHHETLIVQDHNYTDTTQSTIHHTQQYQVPMHPSQYPMEQMNTQNISSYNGQNDYNQNKHHHEANENNQLNDANDDDSESSFVSGKLFIF